MKVKKNNKKQYGSSHCELGPTLTTMKSIKATPKIWLALHAYLPMFIENVSIETIRVGETLRPRAFSDADNSMLLGMKNSSLGKDTYKVQGGCRPVIQPNSKDLSTRLWGINPTNSVVTHSLEPHTEVYCFRLNRSYARLRNMLKSHHQASFARHFLRLSFSSWCFHVGILFIMLLWELVHDQI